MKRYGQACAIARALDVVGERWSLLLVRELTLGPRRYRDLATGLPGIPSTVLAGRLKDLQAAGAITRPTLPPPPHVTVHPPPCAPHGPPGARPPPRAPARRPTRRAAPCNVRRRADLPPPRPEQQITLRENPPGPKHEPRPPARPRRGWWPPAAPAWAWPCWSS